MLAGFWVADITPPLGMEMPGGYGKSYESRLTTPSRYAPPFWSTTARHSPSLASIPATCRSPTIGGMGCGGRSKRAAASRPAHVMLAASHTHSGGPLSWYESAAFAGASQYVQTLVRDHSTNPDPRYLDWVAGQVLSAVSEAHRRREEARLSIGSGREDQSGYNRRFRMANGRVYTHPGKGNPDIVAPAGPIDPAVGVLGAWSTTGTLLGCLVNFGCHCTTFSGGISADYVCYLERTSRR